MKKLYFSILYVITLLHSLNTKSQNQLIINEINPMAGSIAGGDTISVFGKGFIKSDSIVNLFFKGPGHMNGQALAYVVHSDTLIKFVTTAQSSAQTNTFYMILKGSINREPKNASFKYAAPVLEALSKDTSGLAGGDTILIKGKYFRGADQVYFGQSPVTPFDVTNNSLKAVSPTNGSGSTNVQVKVVNTKSAINASSNFFYSLPQPLALSPDSSTVKGNDTIYITGKYLHKATYVKFGDAGAIPQIISPNLIKVVNPNHKSGKVPVTVQVNGSFSSKNNAPIFKYESSLPDSNYTLSLSNLTALGDDYKIYVLGFSTGSKKMLTIDNTDKSASFTDITKEIGYIESFELGTQVDKIHLNNKNPIIGARIYFFVAKNGVKYQDNSSKTTNENLGFKYANKGSAVYQVQNPPQTAFPQYSYLEVTFKTNQGLYIDASNVDGFFFPISVLAQDTNGKELDRIGQNKGVSGSDVINAYKPFMESQVSDTVIRDAYKQLILQTAEGSSALINPGLYLENENSHLETIFDDPLNRLFTDKSLNIWQNDNKGFEAFFNVSCNSNVEFGNTGNKHGALAFKTANLDTLYVFNPVGFSVVSFLDSSSNVRKPIMGHIKDKTLFFKEALPLNVGLKVGMFVNDGGGSTDGKTKITAIQTTDNKITSVSLSQADDYPVSFQYKFAKAPTNYYMSSAQMVYAGIGVLADGTDRYTNVRNQVLVNGFENQISTALNRGVALQAPMSSNKDKNGRTTLVWAQETLWYPGNDYQNYFAYFMHTAKTANGTYLFSLPKDSVKCASGVYMAKAYGFAYDETPSPLGKSKEAQVPSEFSAKYPKGTVKLELILGPWETDK